MDRALSGSLGADKDGTLKLKPPEGLDDAGATRAEEPPEPKDARVLADWARESRDDDVVEEEGNPRILQRGGRRMRECVCQCAS